MISRSRQSWFVHITTPRSSSSPKHKRIVYPYLQQDRARIQLYMTYNIDSPLTWPETKTTKNVLLDEDKIGFHVCINPFLNETASFADMVLPWATYMERWDVDARGAYNLKPYLSMLSLIHI